MCLRKMQPTGCWEIAPIEIRKDFSHWHQSFGHNDFLTFVFYFTHYFGLFSHETLLLPLTHTNRASLKFRIKTGIYSQLYHCMQQDLFAYFGVPFWSLSTSIFYSYYRNVNKIFSFLMNHTISISMFYILFIYHLQLLYNCSYIP